VTLVLAIRCRDGVVLASDGQATTEAAGQPTRAPVRKLFGLGGRMAWGAAGSMGLQQALAERLSGAEAELAAADDPRELLAGIVIPIQQRALIDFVAHPDAPPPDLACIFCWWSRSGPRIWSIPRTGSDHQLHDHHSAVGTGDIFAQFAMASIAHLGTPELSLEQAKMVAYKAIADAIEVAAVFLGPPIQMSVVTAAGAREVSRLELEGALSDSVDAWKARQRETLGPLAPPGGAPLAAAEAVSESAASGTRAS
jgi:proteasome beta subunit